MPAPYLPTEVVLEILHWVTHSDSQREYKVVLRNLSLCSKRFNRLVTPILYAKSDLEQWNQEASRLITLLRNPRLGYVETDISPILQRSHFLPLLTLLSNSRSFSKSLVINQSHPDICDECEFENGELSPCLARISELRFSDERSFDDGELSLCKARISELCISESDKARWVQDLKEKKRSALAGLIMSCLPNLESICFSDYEECDKSRFGKSRHDAPTLPS
jgi:hypothetical protein